jgi:hypothetical protein
VLGPEINDYSTNAGEFAPSISADGSTLYWCAGPVRSGGADISQLDLWQSTISPIVDFNSDGKVDIQDLLILIEHWGQNDPLCDMGPMPWGDGKVDQKDLEVLMSYWGQEVYDPTLIAYWTLDEAEGTIATDSVSGMDGTLIGSPLWQPAGGMVEGALQLDGIDDYVNAPFALSLPVGAFSVFAWVQGSAPGQVVVSQAGGVNWLSTEPTLGWLVSDLKPADRYGRTLWSQTVITDGNWHRIGLVCDGSKPMLSLYVDGEEVAQTQTRETISVPSSSSDLHIGAGKKLEGGTFWSGLIDDVRIYNRAVMP